MITTVNVEILAVSEVNRYLSRSTKMVPYIGTSNTFPLWDGDIVVYDSCDTNNLNRNVDRLIKVQVKGRIHKTKTSFSPVIKYKIPVSDLNHYRKNGGIAYFVVCFNEKNNESKIYCALLTPEQLKTYLREAPGQKTTSIKLSAVPEIERFYWYCINFLNNRDWQSAFQTENLSPINIISKQISFNISGPGSTLIDVLDYNVGTDIPIYNTIEIGNHTIQLPSGREGRIVNCRCHKNVSIDGHVWYESFKSIKINDAIFYSIGNVLSIVVESKKKTLVQVSLFNGTPFLSDIMNASEFVKTFLKSKKIQIDDIEYNIDFTSQQNGILQLLFEAQLLRKTLDKEGLVDDVRMSELKISRDKNDKVCLLCAINDKYYAVTCPGIDWSSLIQAS
jgi:hypothetical protein